MHQDATLVPPQALAATRTSGEKFLAWLDPESIDAVVRCANQEKYQAGKLSKPMGSRREIHEIFTTELRRAFEARLLEAEPLLVQHDMADREQLAASAIRRYLKGHSVPEPDPAGIYIPTHA